MAEECCGCFIERGRLLFIEPLHRLSANTVATGERQSWLFRRWKWWFSVDCASWECEKTRRSAALWNGVGETSTGLCGDRWWTKKISKVEKMSNLNTQLELQSSPSKPSYAMFNGFERFSSSLNLYISTQTKTLLLRPFYLYQAYYCKQFFFPITAWGKRGKRGEGWNM